MTANGHVHVPTDDLSSRMSERYMAGATLDQLAVEFHMPASRCRHLLLDAGVALRRLTPPQPGQWFEPSTIPRERQREIAEAYRAFPAYEVAAAYGIPLHWVARIARLHGIRKAAPRGYRKRRGSGAQARPPAPAPTPTRGYVAMLVVEAHLEAPSWEAAVAQLRHASMPIHIVRVCEIRRLVALDSRVEQP